MTTERHEPKRWTRWTIQIKVWKILAALIILPILVLWYRVVNQDDEILALVRSDVVTDAGQRAWAGSFVNTNDRTLRDVAVTVDFLDGENRPVGKVKAEAVELPFGGRLDLQAPLPLDAVRLRIYSVQWRMEGGHAALMGPFRESWEFGYLMVNPSKIDR
jgi:hypothetical protein